MPGLSLRDGTPTGGVYGFASLAFEVIRKLNPDYVTVAWDKPKTNIRRRKEIYPEYKAGRKPAPPDFYAQIPMLHELLKALGWPLYECDDYEADDIMGALSKQANDQGIESYLISSDMDMLQIVDHDTKMYALKKGLSNIEEFDIAHFEEKYQIRIDQFLDLKALKGDSSDNIPGVPGIGEKTAIQLLQKYDNLDNIFAHAADESPAIARKLEAGKESAHMSKKLSEIWFDAPVTLDLKASDIHNLDYQALVDELKKLEFNSLIRRIPKEMQPSASDPAQASLFSTAKTSSLSELKEVNFDPASTSSEQLFIYSDPDGGIWGSLDSKSGFKIAPDDLTSLQHLTLVAYDAKAFYHTLDSKGAPTVFPKLYDISQAAFLLNPLARDFSISTLIQEEVAPEDALKNLSALRQIYDHQQKEFKNLPKLKTIADDLDFPLVNILFNMEKVGIKINTDFFAQMSERMGEQYKGVEQQIYGIAGYEFNINSPYQLADVLFNKLQLPTTGIKKGARGYSTGQKELDKLRGRHEVIELIEKARELSKLKSTYVDAIPKLADSDHRVHTTFTQNVTSTGRLSSVNPNLQNIPVRTDAGKEIRTGFIAEPGNVFISADYSQFELRLAAILSGDQVLIDDFNDNLDIHTKTASDVFGIPLNQVTPDQRRAAKVINFGVLYGMSPRGLSQATGMSFSESKKFIDDYFRLRAPIQNFINATLEKAKTDGYVETYFGRRRPTPDINSSNFQVREAAKRAAANMPIQGTEADLMKRAMIKLDKEIGSLGRQILQIHDSIMVECSKANAPELTKLLKTTMESIAPELPIKLAVDVKTGSNWGEL